MSRTPNVNSSGWLPLWGSNNQSSTVDNSTNTNMENDDISSSNYTPKLTNDDIKKQNLELKKDRDSTKAIKPKASSSSLVNNANNWLSWSSKRKVDNVEHHLDNDDSNEQHLEESNDAENQENEIDDRENDDYLADDNGDEIDKQISNDNRKKPSSSWTFWNNGSHNANDIDSNNKNKDKKEKDKKINISNRILQSTPSLPNKQDISDSNEQKATKIDKANDKTNDKEEGTPPLSEQSGEDDAVLYKPHDNAKQFSKINTHKNENLKENVIVPDWRLCLPPQNSSSNSLATTLFGNSSTMNQGTTPSSKADMTNWRQFIHQLSTKLGFNTQSLTNVVENESDTGSDNSTTDNNERMEKEFDLIYEKAYRLYGRSLAKLPPAKRACLPNYDKFYTRLSNEESTEHTRLGDNQLEDDSNDPNSISITNDPMGNLLINHKPRPAKNSKLNINSSDIITHKSGPLQKIKKILIIGVHGFFPTKMIRPLIGAPKGTSLKFANEAEKALIRYCIENGLITEDESCNVSIQKIALEKEGKIFDRVEFFTEILTSWQTELNEADFIFIASHSQGCVVSIILLAKLIKMGILKDPIKKRIGILGMAGINNGPFYGVDKSFFMKAYSAIEHESMTELFELTKFTSQQSLVYKESTQIIINANIKICFIGSINDQLVPLYSALASHIFHPNIYRACYIDHSSQTPLFVQKLVSLCCQLQNLGYFDNNVLKELSTVLAGPLTGGGHSKIYNDGKVYDLGIKFVLDTDDVVIPPTLSSTLLTKDFPYPFELNKINSKTNLVTSGVGTYGPIDHVDEVEEVVKVPITNHVYIKEYNVGKIGTNPFILPWCLRGLIFNIEKNWPNNNKLLTVDNGDDMGKNGYDEIGQLYELFENWKPDSKLLKDLKFRLNGIRASKL